MFTQYKTSEKNRITNLFAILLLLFMFGLAIFSSIGDSGTVDEVAHIPSGYSYVKYLDYRLNPEHPPLAKALAGLPLALQHLNGIKDDWSFSAVNQWEAGWYFLYEAGNNPAQIFFWSRLPMIFLMLGLGLFLFYWARKFYGRKIGLLVLFLYAFYPDILAHGRLVTTDVAAAFGYAITVFAFDQAIKRKTWSAIVYAALAFGLAQLLKFSAFLLFAILLILVIYRAFQERGENNIFWSKFWQYFKIYFWICFFSLIVVWLVYIPFVWNTPASVEHQVINLNLPGSDQRVQFLRNFLYHFEGSPFTRAIGHYILGIFLVIGRVAGGNATFIIGHLSDKGIWWYFPVAWLIKTPISIILLLLWSIILLFVYRPKSKEDSWQNWLFLTPIVVYWAFTLKGSLNIGIRHLIPTIPFVLLFIGKSMHRYFTEKILSVQGIIIFVLLILMAGTTISYYPQYISYFNFLVPRDKRYQYLTDSSLDWGQDLIRLKSYVDENDIKNIKVDYFGGSVPKYYIPESQEWHSSYGPTTGWIAVSATFYQSSKLYGKKQGTWSYEWLDEQTPEAIIGGSILVFNIRDEDLASHPPKSSYPIKADYQLDDKSSSSDSGRVGDKD